MPRRERSSQRDRAAGAGRRPRVSLFLEIWALDGEVCKVTISEVDNEGNGHGAWVAGTPYLGAGPDLVVAKRYKLDAGGVRELRRYLESAGGGPLTDLDRAVMADRAAMVGDAIAEHDRAVMDEAMAQASRRRPALALVKGGAAK